MGNTKVKYSFAEWCRDNNHEDWLYLWDYELNEIGPEEITYGSKQKRNFRCCDCGHLFQKRLDYVIHYGLRCNNCGDGISYPNKYVREFLCQLGNMYNFKLYCEHTFEWSNHIDQEKNRRLYDCVIKDDHNIVVIEIHGGQHYFESFLFDNTRTLLEEQKNDLFKYNLAIANGIKPDNYIIIDARESDDLWIKQSIIQCGIKKIYPFKDDDIDWNKCRRFASSNMAKQVCDKYADGNSRISDLCTDFALDRKTIKTYLKQGAKNGWCNYTSQPRNKNNPMICLNNGLIFASASECERVSERVFNTRLLQQAICQVLCNKRDSYKGYYFKKISTDEFEIQKNINPNVVFGNLY